MNGHPYPAYKPSGIEWLGEIPAHWEVKRLKHVTRCLDGKRVPLNSEQRGEKQGDIPYWGANGVLDHLDEFLFDEPLVLLGEDGAPFFDHLKDVAFYVNEKVWVNNHAHVLRPVGIEPVFLAYALNMVEYRKFVDGTTRDKLTQDDMNQITIQTPPVDEQRTIAVFLDRETARIDALIEKKQQQIELLREKRTAFISHTVTKGLDPNAKMKDSGIEWLGEIPERWKVLSCKFAYTIQLGKMLQNEPQSATDVKVPYLKALDVQWETVDTSEPPEMWASQCDIEKFSVRSGDLLVCEGGEVGRAGMLADAPDDCIIQNALHRVRAKGRNDAQYLMYLLEVAASSGWFDVICNKATIAHFTGEKFGDFLVALPPPSEQRAIATFLNRETTRIDTLIEKVEKSIDLLREYRTSLISAAVTGKIDVRKESS